MINIYKLTRTIKHLKKISNIFFYMSTVYYLFRGIVPILYTNLFRLFLNCIQSETNLKRSVDLMILFISLKIIDELLSSVYEYYSYKYKIKLNYYIEIKRLEKSSKLTLSDYEDSETYNVISLANHQNADIFISYYSDVLSIISRIITLICAYLILLSYSKLLSLLIIIFPTIKFFLNNKFNRINFNIIKKFIKDNRKLEYFKYLINSGKFYKDLKIIGLFNYFIYLFKKTYKKINKEFLRVIKSQTISFTVINILSVLLDLFIFKFFIIDTNMMKVLIGDIVGFMQIKDNAEESVDTLLENFSNIKKNELYIDQYYTFINLKEDKEKNVIIDKINSIELVNLSFKYPNSNDYILKDISFRMEKNERVAICGLNGCGKTTLIKLIMGLYEDYKGEILINDINIKKINKRDLYKKMSVLFQDFTKFESTVAENIACSNLDILNNDIELVKYSESLNLFEELKLYNRDLNQMLGIWFDGAKELSFGQWQKLAIARSLLKESDVFVFDEPDSSIDIEYFNKHFEEIGARLSNKLLILVTHKFSTYYSDFTKIIYLENGRILEIGNHCELIKLKGKYFKLYKKYLESIGTKYEERTKINI